MTLDKLPAIRGDLVRMDPEWEKWNFTQFSKGNPVEEQETSGQLNLKHDRSNKLFQARGGVLAKFHDWKTSGFLNRSNTNFVWKEKFCGKIVIPCWTSGVCC